MAVELEAIIGIVGLVLALLGVIVPVCAAVWEFGIAGRKRLGYRVQMDTPLTGEVQSGHAQVFENLTLPAGTDLADVSIVLLRVHNHGVTDIVGSDYLVNDDNPTGVRVRLPGRRVLGVAVTELRGTLGLNLEQQRNGDPRIRMFDDEAAGAGIIDLPRVPLKRRGHYKILAVLRRWDSGGSRFHRYVSAPAEVHTAIEGGTVTETEAPTEWSKRVLTLIAFLVVVIVGLGVTTTVTILQSPDSAPLDCASGNLTLTGSTAFSAVMKDAAESYRKTCPGAQFAFDFDSSDSGLQKLNETGKREQRSPAMVAITDGVKPDKYPELLAQPIALALFTLVVNKKAGVSDLSPKQIQELYDGKIANWKEIGGTDVPVRLVGRYPDSGTRQAFQQRILEHWESGPNSRDCETIENGTTGTPHCFQSSTEAMLSTVARIDGAIGYSEFGSASKNNDVVLVHIDGHKATRDDAVHRAYPFWGTEYAYTYQEPKADSLVASFLRYLAKEVGKDIIRSHGNLACADLENPVLCQPPS
ncbi:PstS family phosphate ABC transporter substrate-binding protein [Nocardia abscessus]|uniref:PstS family phosphate ABC transporter substrate-binding protein n=1 Tax=Nocardia abscessus TaxID=120957 RepID=UPI001C3F4B3E|nr:substrate-binding domain-containing protein [Nocardia abscessus]MCC3330918.1 substrate-binding domain-containing protein [Nocardia abscessus]